MAQILQPYKAPVVYNDLSQNEVLGDMFYSLENLSGTINDIFSRMEKRIADERRRVDQIKARVATCKSKVESVKGTSQATTIFSTAKFPAPKNLPSYPTLFSQVTEMPSPYRDVEDDIVYLPASTHTSTIGNPELESELIAIHTRLNLHNTDIERVEFLMEDAGLGPLPSHMQGVGSMLLFNSNVNPYKDYQTLDNLISGGREKMVEEEQAKGLASAPTTLLNGEALPDIAALDLLFKPAMGEMSALALPENLPLDFLASNVQFSGLDLPSIAPSHHNKANYDLPQITDGGAYNSGPSAKQPKNAAPPPPPSAASAPPPPPPPGAAPPPPPPGAAPPPPPPAPGATAAPAGPPPAPVTETAAAGPPPAPDAAGGGDSAAPPKPAMPSGRAGLLDSIKGMGVSKLRSKDESAAKIVQKKPEAKPLTMAEALKERMARRNEAISGKSDKEAKRRDSMIVQAARNDSVAAPPSSSSALTRPTTSNTLSKVGFLSADDGNAASDDDEFKRAPTKSSYNAVTVSDDDSDSDVASEFSDDSRTGVPPPAAKPKAPVPAPAPTAPAPKPTPKPTPAPASSSSGGGGLLDSKNAALAGMLAKASGKAKADSDSDDSDDGEEDW